MPRSWKEWTTAELKHLAKHYPTSMPIEVIADHVGHSVNACKCRAVEMDLRRPLSCSAQAIRNFETTYGKPLADIARDYRDRRLSRTTLAHDIGIECKALREALDASLWESWPRMTIGRIDAARQRRKAA